MSKNLEKEYLEDLDHYDEGMGIHSTSYEKCKERLIRLARIDNAKPSEALEEIKTLRGFNQVELNNDENVNKSLDIIEQALLKAQEQEKVIKELCEYCGMDNLYPYDNLEEIEITFKDTFDNYSRQRIESLGRLNKLEKENAELRQKAQEPKKYLKWEDLEFKDEEQTMKVLLNGNLYFIRFGLLFEKTQQVELYSKNEEHLMNFNSYYKEDIQFFNDLHLEWVEE